MVIIPPFYPKRKKERSVVLPEPPPPTPAPVLLMAQYYYDVPCLVLTFDREIDISEIQVDQFIVNDVTVYSYTLQGTGEATQATPETVMIPLVVIGPNTGPGLTTTVTNTNGIKSTPNGTNWDGVTDCVTEWAN